MRWIPTLGGKALHIVMNDVVVKVQSDHERLLTAYPTFLPIASSLMEMQVATIVPKPNQDGVVR